MNTRSSFWGQLPPERSSGRWRGVAQPEAAGCWIAGGAQLEPRRVPLKTHTPAEGLQVDMLRGAWNLVVARTSCEGSRVSWPGPWTKALESQWERAGLLAGGPRSSLGSPPLSR